VQLHQRFIRRQHRPQHHEVRVDHLGEAQVRQFRRFSARSAALDHVDDLIGPAEGLSDPCEFLDRGYAGNEDPVCSGFEIRSRNDAAILPVHRCIGVAAGMTIMSASERVATGCAQFLDDGFDSATLRALLLPDCLTSRIWSSITTAPTPSSSYGVDHPHHALDVTIAVVAVHDAGQVRGRQNVPRRVSTISASAARRDPATHIAPQAWSIRQARRP